MQAREHAETQSEDEPRCEPPLQPAPRRKRSPMVVLRRDRSDPKLLRPYLEKMGYIAKTPARNELYFKPSKKRCSV